MRFLFSCKFVFDLTKNGGGFLKRFFLFFGIFSIVASSFLIYRYRKQLLQKLNKIEFQLRNAQLKSRIKEKAVDTISSLKNVLKRSDTKNLYEKEETLKIVEQKIRQLEELMKR